MLARTNGPGFFTAAQYFMGWVCGSVSSPLTFQRQKCIFSINIEAFEGLVDFFFLQKYTTFIFAHGGAHTAVTTQIFSNTQPGD